MRRKVITICLIICLTLLSVAATPVRDVEFVSEASIREQVLSELMYEAESRQLRSTTTLYDQFYDSVISVIMSRYVDVFHDFTPDDFPEISIANIQEETPGLDLARRQVAAITSLRPNSFYYDMNWQLILMCSGES